MAPTCALSLSAYGGRHCAAYQNGSVWCWGTGDDVGESPSAIAAPARVEGVSGAKRVLVGPGHSCAETAEGLVCWGKNDAFQIDESSISPLGPTPPELGWSEPSPSLSVGLGAGQTCRANFLRHVYCRGLDVNGLHLDSEQIGALGNAPGVQTQNPQLLTSDHPLALEGGVVYAIDDWRAPSRLDFYGTDNVFVRPGTPACAVKTDGSLWCGDYLLTDPGKLERRAALDEAALWVGSGEFFACALTVSRRVWCEGWNTAGQLGRGSIDDSSQLLAGDWVEGLEDVEALSVNRFSVCALSGDRSIACWGAYGPEGQHSRPTRVSGCEG
jgi:hypothetical protein